MNHPPTTLGLSAVTSSIGRDTPRKASPGLWQKTGKVYRGIRPFARNNVGPFSVGIVAAVGVVATRLALPWPMRAIADHLTSPAAPQVGIAGIHPVLLMGITFVVLSLILGFSDFMERLHFARFAIGTTRDLRNAAFKKALDINGVRSKAGTGDLVARLIGDAARLKAGLQGFLVHVATNGLLFLGMTIVLFWLDARLGTIFAAAGFAALAITVWGASRVFENSLEHRSKEGRLANEIDKSMKRGPDKKTLKKINRSSGRSEAAQTRLQGYVTWAVHGIFGIAVLAALWVGASAVARGSLSVGNMIVFMMYALMMQGPVVRLARQGTRTGKILGPGFRLIQILKKPARRKARRSRVSIKTLKSSLTVSGLDQNSGWNPGNFKINRGEHVAVICADPARGTALLEILSGQRRDADLGVRWDGIDLRGKKLSKLSKQVRLVQFPSTEPLDCRVQRLAHCLHDRASVWLFAYPEEGLSEAEGTSLMKLLTERNLEARKAPAVVVLTRLDHPDVESAAELRLCWDSA